MNGICSDDFALNAFKVYSCPFEEDACGNDIDFTLATDGDPTSI
jgi:hypothetical protein